MSREASELLKRALSLPEEERTLLAASLLDSLNSSADLDVELAWQQEVARRLDALDQGRGKMVPWIEVRQPPAAKLPRIESAGRIP